MPWNHSKTNHWSCVFSLCRMATEVGRIIREHGALPATVAVMNGKICVGELTRPVQNLFTCYFLPPIIYPYTLSKQSFEHYSVWHFNPKQLPDCMYFVLFCIWGLSGEHLEMLAHSTQEAIKTSRRDLPYVLSQVHVLILFARLAWSPRYWQTHLQGLGNDWAVAI